VAAQVAAACLVAWIAWRARVALLPFAFALALAYLLAPPVATLERRRLPAWLAVLVVYAGAAMVVAVLVGVALPTLVREGRHLLAAYPTYTRAARAGASAFWRSYNRMPLPAPLRVEASALLVDVGNGIRAAARASLHALAAGVPVVASAVVAPFLAYYMLRDRIRLWAAFWRHIPPRRRHGVASLLGELDAAVGGFVRGQLLVAAVVGALAFVTALAFRLPYPLFIAAVAAATDIIPYVGPLLGAVPAVAFALLRSPVEGLWVLAAFLAIHELEGTVVSPYLLGNQVGLHPLAVFGAILVGGDLFGFVGLLVAVPALAAVRIVGRYAFAQLRGWAGIDGPADAGRAVARRRPRAFPTPRPVR